MAATKTIHKVTMAMEAGNASLAELGKMLGQAGVNIREVQQLYDTATAGQRGDIVPVVVSVYDDRSFTLEYKTPPTSFLIRKALGVKGSARPGHEHSGTLTAAQLRQIAEVKLPDLNTSDLEAAMRTAAGTARSMGVSIAEN